MKVMWFELAYPGEPKEFNSQSNKGGYVFLYYVEEQLLVAGHCCLQCQRLADVAGSHIPRRKPDGAGWVNHFRVSEWFSSGFNVDTPEGYRTDIKKALGLPERPPE